MAVDTFSAALSSDIGIGKADALDPYSILAHLPLGVFVCDMDDAAGYPLPMMNARARSLLKLDDMAESTPFCLDEVPILEFGEPLLSQLQKAAQSERAISYDWTMETPALAFHFRCDITPLKAVKGSPKRVLCTITDRTAEKRAENNLLYHALHDGLTGLPNRSHFLNRLEEAIARFRAGESKNCAVLMLNVDRFQLINESFGQKAGDRFLVELADGLRGYLRHEDTLARFNGDEFAILVDDISDTNDALTLASRIHEMMRTPRSVGETEATMSVSIGIASTETSNHYPEDVIRDADISMHRAKKTGRGTTEIFECQRHAIRSDQIYLETALRDAIETRQLELFYQPIIDLRTGEIIAFEALTRWHHPERGFISPGDFIPLAEDTGLIVPLGRWAMEEACAQLSYWLKTLPVRSDMYVNVNMSAVQFVHDNIPNTVAQILEKTGLEPTNLRLEITESALVDDPAGAAKRLHEIKKLGPTLALDDFGTGYSSLNYLNNFPIDCIKIDRSFVSRIDRDEQSAKIVRVITTLADALHLSVVAEGIENTAQKDLMSALGCCYGQGFLFARPLPRDEFAELLCQDPSQAAAE